MNSQLKRLAIQTGKPIVGYRELEFPLRVGARAYVRRIYGHPRQGQENLNGLGTVVTSKVLSIHQGDVFETENTIYKRMGSS